MYSSPEAYHIKMRGMNGYNSDDTHLAGRRKTPRAVQSKVSFGRGTRSPANSDKENQYQRLAETDPEDNEPFVYIDDKRQATRGLFRNRNRDRKLIDVGQVKVRKAYKTKRGRRRYVIKDTVISKRRLSAYLVGESLNTTQLFRKLEAGSIYLQPSDKKWVFSSRLDVVHGTYTKANIHEAAPAPAPPSTAAKESKPKGKSSSSRSRGKAPVEHEVSDVDEDDDRRVSVITKDTKSKSKPRTRTRPSKDVPAAHDPLDVDVDGDERDDEPDYVNGDAMSVMIFSDRDGARPIEEVGEEDLGEDPVVDEISILRMESQVDVFFFPEGCLVFWGCETEDEELAIINCVKSQIVDIFDETDWYQDELDFCYSLGKDVRPHLDMVYLSTLAESEKLAVSYALAQSKKLEEFEDDVEEVITENADVPNQLAATGHITVGKIELSKRIGRLFITRTAINLRSDLLDTPEFFWDTDFHEPKYHTTLAYFDVAKRITVINTRLEMVHELLEMLTSIQDHAEGSRLEWIIIILIVVEILVAVDWKFVFMELHITKGLA